MDKLNDWGFALFSANLHQLLPDIPWQQHAACYREHKHYHRPRAIATVAQWDVSAIMPYNKEPHILCLFHLGYHAQLPYILAAQGVQFDMILDRKVFEAQQDQLLAMQSAMQSGGGSYRFLLSDSPTVLLQARSALQDGRHLLVFADGNSGTTDRIEDKVEIGFLAGSLYVRKGIAVLSYLTRSTIVPIAHRQEGRRFKLTVGEAISPLTASARDHYLQDTMQRLYAYLGGLIRQEPWLWESWSYLHQLNCFTAANTAGKEMNQDQQALIPIRLNGVSGFFDRIRYCFSYSWDTLRK
ncbi:lysophospholipid acyltransferase family protein [Sphingobacterium paucimobilis]|uniref:Lipid A biosynthesis acyltransferase n=1 Tax=Sphingobacterium paucimobilis HER1398 TaxID=1346330 RepID=U2J2Y3_9SPHI|nr:hypothetical protein [Sphingobacterium paucimobilis]ERJ59329.1 hypothetical protein M472_11145 [Sphingobacterium paucimobilis HER1398]